MSNAPDIEYPNDLIPDKTVEPLMTYTTMKKNVVAWNGLVQCMFLNSSHLK